MSEKSNSKKVYKDEFKKECVEHYLQGSLSQQEVAVNFGVSTSALGKWIREYRNRRDTNQEEGLLK